MTGNCKPATALKLLRWEMNTYKNRFAQEMQSGRVHYTRVFALNPVLKFRGLNMSITMPKGPVELQTSEDAEHLVKLLHLLLRQTVYTTHVLISCWYLFTGISLCLTSCCCLSLKNSSDLISWSCFVRNVVLHHCCKLNNCCGYMLLVWWWPPRKIH